MIKRLWKFVFDLLKVFDSPYAMMAERNAQLMAKDSSIKYEVEVRNAQLMAKDSSIKYEVEVFDA